MNKLPLFAAVFFCQILSVLGQDAALRNQVFPGEETAPVVSLWELILSGGWIMIPLGVLSVITVALVLLFLFSLRRSAAVTSRYMHTAETLIRKGDLQSLMAVSNRHGEAVARVMSRSLDFAQRNPDADFKAVRDVVETEGMQQAVSWNQRVGYLSDIGAIAPMVGLLGTVIGMIQAFSVISGDVPASRHMLLAEAVSIALVATAGGLIIGVPALAAYAYFRSRVVRLVAELESACTELVALLAIHFGASGKSGAGGSLTSPPLPTRQRAAASGKSREALFNDDF